MKKHKCFLALVHRLFIWHLYPILGTSTLNTDIRCSVNNEMVKIPLFFLHFSLFLWESTWEVLNTVFYPFSTHLSICFDSVSEKKLSNMFSIQGFIGVWCHHMCLLQDFLFCYGSFDVIIHRINVLHSTFEEL